MKRNPASHKGENGKVAIIGGSRHQHGAPLFSALAAEASGVDLVYVIVPQHHAEVAKQVSLNFQVHAMAGDDFTESDVPMALQLLATMESAVIGPGLSRDPKSIKAVNNLVGAASCALVLDATALQPETINLAKGKTAVLTPHLGELERMELAEHDLQNALKGSNAIIHLKGETDRILSAKKADTIIGGNAGLTVGGTGDALAGVIAGLIAQRVDPFDACVMASTVIKRAGTQLFHDKGYAYTTRDVIALIPHLLHTL